MTPVENRLLTTREAATEFRVHPTTIRRWVAGGLLKAVPTPGRHGRYRESDIKAAMQTDDDQPAPINEVRTPEHIATAAGDAITSAASTPRAAQTERRAGDYSTDSPQMSSLTGQSSEGTTAS